MAWTIRLHPAVERWYLALPDGRAERFASALDALEREGPLLGRPVADSIKGSRYHHMKELRCGGGVRALFAFDPVREAIVLTAGDKTGKWDRWYPGHIALAEQRYSDHLRETGREDACLQPRPGERSAASGR